MEYLIMYVDCTALTEDWDVYIGKTHVKYHNKTEEKITKKKSENVCFREIFRCKLIKVDTWFSA